jgi:hypothetical protein
MDQLDDTYVDQLDDSYLDDKSSVIDNTELLSLLGVIATWFIRIGLAIGALLLVYYIVIGNIFSALLFVLGLVVSYFFGYFFMFCLDKFMSQD